MIILIDGYNLLKTILHVQFVSPYDKHKHLTFLQHYALLKKHEIIIIFDGDVNDIEKKYHKITIDYSGYSLSADDVIKKKIAKMHSLDLLLVTCDRELRNYAKQFAVESIGSLDFYRLVQSVMQQKEQEDVVVAQTIHKTSIDDNPDLDALMEFGSRMLVTKDLDKKRILTSVYNDKKYSKKKDKKLLRKIVKI